MKPIVLVLVSAAVGAAVSAGIFAALREPAPARAAATASPDVAVAQKLDALEARFDKALASIDDLRMQIAAKETPRVPVGEIDAAVQRAMSQRSHASAPAAEPAEEAAADAKGKKLDAKSLYEELTAPGLGWDERQEMWKRAREAGLLDEVVAMFEERAKDRPNDAKAQVDLGHAYLQKTFAAGGGPEAGVWATKADKAYDKALAIDDHNWEGRFSKAVSLSFWPAALGKQHEAIAQFQTLVQQQKSQAQKPEFAQSHLWLGNLYTQIGEKDKALAAWQQGLALFPNDPELQHQIEMAQSH